jgi:hypothetical protein
MAEPVPSIFASFCEFSPLLVSPSETQQGWTETRERELVAELHHDRRLTFVYAGVGAPSVGRWRIHPRREKHIELRITN